MDGTTPHNLRAAFAVFGPLVRPGVYGGGPFSHHSLLRTLEDGFVIAQHLRNTAHASPISRVENS